ncbi:alcohol dehydrogenase catalytic domain-containing protein [Actinokineospora sp. UTMC 2448]|uniref:alcohol dehydrogenase catalytic domain-containing protein n=1 Tax=Actinokineospora sp. UTMC 2448 TaxID=2268449 RepID=UPI002164714F|nr:alcohol dehydrogenase catalytic domain-containing protein [Actinokineospora sp. UTMC 2448]
MTATCVCGADLWPYRGVEPADHQVMGHEYVGVVEEVGADVRTVAVGDFVVGRSSSPTTPARPAAPATSPSA